MIINCNVTGSERKRLAESLGTILRWEPVYTKAPSFAYVVNNYTVDKLGSIICPDSATTEDLALIVAKLRDEGFSPEIMNEASTEDINATSILDEVTTPAADDLAEIPAETPDVAPETEPAAQPAGEAQEAAEGAETPDVAAEPAEGDTPPEDIPDQPDAENEPTEDISADEDNDHLTISIPRTKLPDDALERLKVIVRNKETLFKRALLIDDLPIETTEEEIAFPWFTLTGIDGETEAYSQFIVHLCEMANEQTRVLNKPYDGDNDRFAMRIFMVRLGMKGAQFALIRKLMMKHLTGNSGWRYGAPPKKADLTTALPEEAETPVEAEPTADTEMPADGD